MSSASGVIVIFSSTINLGMSFQKKLEYLKNKKESIEQKSRDSPKPEATTNPKPFPLFSGNRTHLVEKSSPFQYGPFESMEAHLKAPLPFILA